MTTPAASDSEFTPEDLRNLWRILSPDERLEGFRLLPHDDAEEFFLGLGSADLASLLLELPRNERRAWMRLLPPDDSADLIQQVPEAEREGLLALLDDATRHEVTALLAYAQDAAGGLMNPRYARLRPEMTVDEAIGYLRRQARTNLELLSYLYAIDADQRLLGVVSFRELFAARPERTVREVMRRDLVTVRDDQDQEEVSQILAEHDLIALPVVDRDGRMKGIVTVDDIVDVVQAEATEDIQKLGGMEAMEVPYLEIAFGRMLRRRGGFPPPLTWIFEPWLKRNRNNSWGPAAAQPRRPASACRPQWVYPRRTEPQHDDRDKPPCADDGVPLLEERLDHVSGDEASGAAYQVV